MAKNRYKRKISVKKIIGMVLVGALLVGILSSFAAFAKDDSQPAGIIFSRGGLDESTGKYLKTNQSIYTEKAFRCDGLRIEPDFESDVTYDVYFYDEDMVLLDKKLGLTEVFDSDFDLAKYARIVIHPTIPKDVSKRDFEIKRSEIFKIASQLKITVSKDQTYFLTENGYNAEELKVGFYFGDSEKSYNSNNLIEHTSSITPKRAITNIVEVDPKCDTYVMWVYVSVDAKLTTSIYLFDADGNVLKDSNGNVIGAGVNNETLEDRPKWVPVIIEIPELDSYEGVHLRACVSGDTTSCYIYGYND